MTSFMRFILRHFILAAAAIGIAAIAGGLLLGILWRHQEKKHPERLIFPWKWSVALVFVGYLAVLLWVTVLGRNPSYGGNPNFHLFRAFREAWNYFDQQHFLNILINILMFLPVGLFLPIFHQRLRHIYVPITGGFLLACVIELAQLLTGRGLLDVDDLVCNTFGAFLGGCLILAGFAMLSGKFRLQRCCLWLLPPVLGILSVLLVIGIYHFREYGNLPAAPAYRVSTKDLEFQVHCDFPETPTEARVYLSPAMTREEADLFSGDFSRERGVAFTKKEYYDGAALYYNEPEDTFLYLLYRDGSYLYQTPRFREPGCQSFSREEMLDALKPFDLVIPEAADFLIDDTGSLLLRVQQLPEGSGMYDGAVRCKFSPEGELNELEQYLIYYPLYDETSVISPREAFRRLQKGNFREPDWNPDRRPNAYEITGWHLEYRNDTKGFYRPVYIFDGLADGKTVPGGLLVPAMD